MKNPTHTTARIYGDTMETGIELPLAAGVSSEALEKGNAMPMVNMTPNDGDNPSVPDAPFADGCDCRSYGSSPSSMPTPGKPGA